MNPEEMLQSSGEQIYACDAGAWRILLRHIIDSLVDWLGYEFETESLDEACIGEAGGFCLDILRACPSNNDLFWWKGILGATILENRIRVSLLVFPRSGTQRLILKDGSEFAEYVYEEEHPHYFKWKLFGWFTDEYGEYDYFLK